MMTITEARRRIEALGGELDFMGKVWGCSGPGARPGWRNLYRLVLPGQPSQIIDKRSIQLMDLPEPGSRDESLSQEELP